MNRDELILKDYFDLLISFISFIILFYIALFIKIKEILLIILGYLIISSFLIWQYYDSKRK